MGIRELESMILQELREVVGSKDLRKKDICEWSSGKVTPKDDELHAVLPKLQLEVAYNLPRPKRAPRGGA